jgi:hypothetical protein
MAQLSFYHPEPFVVALLRASFAKAPLSRGRAKPAEAPSAAEGEGSTRSDSPAASLFKLEFALARLPTSLSVDGRCVAALNEVKGLGARPSSFARLRTAKKKRRLGFSE